MQTHCFTIGYEGRSLDDLCSTLLNHGVDKLIDIRERAWSHRLEYRKTALQNGLAIVGIGYVHFKEAGNSFRPRGDQQRNHVACMRDYRRYLRTNPAVIESAQKVVESGCVAFFCYEAASTKCHRIVLVEELAESLPGLSVDHL